MNTACNSKICFLRFSRSVYGTAHNGYLNIKREFCHHRFYLIGKSDKIYLCSSTGRTGNDFNTALPKSQGSQNNLCRLNLLHRITGKRYTDRISNSLMQNQSQSDRRLDISADDCSCLSNSYMKWIIRLL